MITAHGPVFIKGYKQSDIHVYELLFYFMCSGKAQTSQKLEEQTSVVLLLVNNVNCHEMLLIYISTIAFI